MKQSKVRKLRNEGWQNVLKNMPESCKTMIETIKEILK